MSPLIKTAILVVGLVVAKNQIKKHRIFTPAQLRKMVRVASGALPILRKSKIAKIALAP